MKHPVRFKQETVKSQRHYTQWIKPVMKGYHLACCNCNLVHTINFRAVKIIKRYKDPLKFGYQVLSTKNYHVEMRISRNNKLTAQLRRKK